MAVNNTVLLFNEAELRDHVLKLLKQANYEVQTEVQLPERFRVDILAKKEDITLAIEVKKESRGIPNDIIKCQKLLRLPEVTEAYVAAPELTISPDHVAFATSIGIGVISVTAIELNWVVKSWRLEKANLVGSRENPANVVVGKVFKVTVAARNNGQKIARELEARCLPAGPFVFAPGSKRKYNRSSLYPDNSWAVQFHIKVRHATSPGTYPLFTIMTAQNVAPSQSSLSINILAPDPKEV